MIIKYNSQNWDYNKPICQLILIVIHSFNIKLFIIKFQILKMRTKTIQKFILILFEILENNEHKNYIRWSPDGESFIIPKRKLFQQKVMVNAFNTNNIQSFLRQLSFYKFKMEKNKQNQKQYCHPHFQRGRRDLLSKIQRMKNDKLNEDSTDQASNLEYIKLQNEQLQSQLEKLKLNQQYILKQLIIQAKIQATLASRVERIAQEMAIIYGEERQLEFAKPMRLFFKLIQGYRVDQLERIIGFLIFEMDVPTPIQENYSPIQFPYC
ncbi:unnamed protein product (macronuclear) [Paramecium tetraurelia]|uniref:HSF-type DNA-binding domain-containing protein n=1 Tax=Paramecium tetraurelia TaxID=5888 RepID=A0CG13_PARTE|nr:uncharacterized protein GSPATT00038173001 [Paramecium tetraurelia]CAK69730.1 unnamed protein product [Paramecium tetraurelia]|eukprot:XP_001437127.1 hypothetical protein (macronuclear) [Paramecium tetraurelia strain d4-2]